MRHAHFCRRVAPTHAIAAVVLGLVLLPGAGLTFKTGLASEEKQHSDAESRKPFIVKAQEAYEAASSPHRPLKEGHKPEFDPLKAYPQSEAFQANVAWLKTVGENEVRMSWFLHGDAGVAMVCTADLRRYEVATWREVYDHAHQAGESRKLSHAQVLTLSELVKNLPPSAKVPKLKNVILVSVLEKGQPRVYTYNRLEPPRVIIRLYDLTGAYLSTHPVE